MPSRQTLVLGREASMVEEGLARLSAERVIPRLWERDASLWTSDQLVQQAIRKRLGWLTAPEFMRGRLDEIRHFATDVRRSGIKRALLLGMGGASLFSEVCRMMVGVGKGGIDLQVLDTTDPTAIRKALEGTPLNQTLAIVSSKSGTTSETSALSKYFYEVFRSAGLDAGKHCVAITDAGSPLERQAKEWQFRLVLTHGPETGSDVGGRFSAFTCFGLFPAALMAIDLARLLDEAEGMYLRCAPHVAITQNSAAILGAVLGMLAEAGRDKLTLICAKELESFGTWLEQLIAESTGKLEKGIAPISGEILHDPKTYGPDRVFVELQIASRLDKETAEHVRLVSNAGHPVVRIHWEDPLDLGGEVAKWSMAVAVAGHIMGINPFDEPNVKESKDKTSELLAHYFDHGGLPEEEPLWSSEGLALYAKPASESVQSLTEALSNWLRQLQSNEYVAVLSFIPRTDEVDGAVNAIRENIARRLACTTMVGFGPRYLHSTGQLFKGGRDAGVFLVLTSDYPEDLSIPGEPFTFGVLKHAQALGDLQAMSKRERRVLRIHCRGNLEQSVAELLGSVDEAITSLA